MAADKKTLLRDALKQVQGGKIEKAIQTYSAVAKIDPRDATVKNTLGDLYLKQGKKKEAITAYLEAANVYEKDGFAMRSIAICQKVANIDPALLPVRIRLGDLYAGLKLPAEARAQYLQAAETSDKNGDIATALEIFRKLADLDPGNLQVRVKLGGMFEKHKRPDKAAEEYVRAARGYFEKKDPNTAAQLCVRAFKLAPSNIEARRWLADHYAQRQDWSVVVGLLETPVKKGSRDTGLLLLYAEALTRVNHAGEAVKVLEPALEREPTSIPLSLVLGRACLKAGQIEKGIAALNRCVGAHLAENRLEPAEALLLEMGAASPEDDSIPQRLLEVAQKRGDKDAIASAHFRLADLYEEKGLVRAATSLMEKYLEAFPGEAKAQQRLKALQALTPAPKVEAPPPPAPRPAPSPPPPPVDEGVEIDLEGGDFTSIEISPDEEEHFLEVEGEEAVAAEPSGVADALALIGRGAAGRAAEFLEEHLGHSPGDAEAWLALIEARKHLGDRSGIRDGFLRLADLHRRARRFDEARAAFEGALEFDPRSVVATRGLADLLVEEEAVFPSTEPPPEPAAEPEAEEEEFTLDLSDEMDELGDLAEPESPAPGIEEPAAAASPPPEPPSEPAAAAEEYTLDLSEELGELGRLEQMPAAPAAAPEPVAAAAAPGEGEFEQFMAEADFYLQQGLLDEAEFLCTKLRRLAPENSGLVERLRKIEQLRGPAPETPADDESLEFEKELDKAFGQEAPAPSPAAALPADGGAPEAAPPRSLDAGDEPGGEAADFADFLGELRQEMGAPLESLPAPPPGEQGEEGLAAIFQEFQRSVKEQLGDEDFETHYNLGIAYKEMSLMNEAIAEFALAEKSPARHLDSTSMIALCLREMGRFDEAALKLRTGIALAVEGSEEQKGLLYDLASLLAQTGHGDEAQEALLQLLIIDPGYRDVAARAGAAPAPPSAPTPDTAAKGKKSKVSYL